MRTRSILGALALTATALAPIVAPRAATATDVAGIPAANVGVHGPVTPHLDDLEIVGYTPIPVQTTVYDDEGVPHEVTLPIGNNGGLALIGDCAYIGRWHDYSAAWGIQTIDVSDPSNPTRVGAITEGLPAGAVAREIRAVDLPGFRILVVLLFARYIDSGATTPGLNAINVYTVADDDCTDVTLAGTLPTYNFRGHEFYLWLDPDRAHDVAGHPRAIVYLTAPIGPPNVLVIDVTRPSAPTVLTAYDAGLPVVSPREEAGTGLGTYAHSISLSPDGREAYLSYWDGGFFTVDTSAIAEASPAPVMRAKGVQSLPYIPPPDEYANTHSAVMIPGTSTAVVGSEVYISTDGCPFGWMKLLDVGDATTPPRLVGDFKLPENVEANCVAGAGLPTDRPRTVSSRNANGLPIDGTFTMHNQTVTRGYALASWYGGGLRVIDVSTPATPTEAASFVPVPVQATATEPATSAPGWGTATPGKPDDDWRVQVWSYPIVRDGLIYVVDTRSGLYVLRATGDEALASELGAIGFVEGNSNLGDLA